MTHLLSIDTAMVDWARAQFALTAIYHWLFVPLTLGLAVVMRSEERRVGNWSNYSYLVGDVFGAPLAIEGIVAFFMESTFVAVMFFGWQKVSKGFHLASTWLTGLGATISAWWILVANSWMQHPVGQEFNPDTMRNEMTSFLQVALSPVAVDKFIHTVLSAWVLGAVFVVGVSSWYLLKQRHVEFARKSLRVGAIFGLVSSLLIMASGHHSAYTVAQTQPMKLAAMEGLYKGGTDQGLTLISGINPFQQPDYEGQDEPPMKLAIPYALSFLATNDIHGQVPGIRDILDGYTKPDGTVEPSLEEKMERGRCAIAAMQEYRKAKREGMAEEYLTELRTEIKDNMPYFGYGYVKERSQVVPNIPVCFYAFRIMVGGGCLFILLFILVLSPLLSSPKGEGTEGKGKPFPQGGRWRRALLWFALLCIPVAYIVSESGWLVAEFGRQPWTIQDMLPTWAAVSDINGSSVALTFVIFLFLFTLMLAVEISILLKQIKQGPEKIKD